MPAASAVTLQEQEVLRKEPILFFLVYYSIVSGAEDFKCSFQTRQVPGHRSLPQSGRTHKAVTGGFQILERTQA